jgi:hypothetical protein
MGMGRPKWAASEQTTIEDPMPPVKRFEPAVVGVMWSRRTKLAVQAQSWAAGMACIRVAALHDNFVTADPSPSVLDR